MKILPLISLMLSISGASSFGLAGETQTEMLPIQESTTDAANAEVESPRPDDFVPPDGAIQLFNGEDLTGWYGRRDISPKKWESADAETLAKWREEDQANMQAHWRVENGEIVNDGQGVFLATENEYGDFELFIDYKTVAKADSGIYLKGCPQVQIWDYTEAGGKWNIGADKGSGGLWNNSPDTPGKDPLVLADKPFGEWNRFRIQQIGQRTSVWLNGTLVVDHALMENYFDRGNPLPASGPILLQTHGGEIRWRNIYVREIPPEETVELLAQKHRDDQFKSLFNGTDFSGWKGPIENYEIVDGTIQCKSGQGGTIFTEEEFADFVVCLQFKLPEAGNNGLAIRYPGEGDTAYVGMCELQVLDANYPGQLDPRQVHGSAYGMVAAKTGFLRSPGEWNFQAVTVKGSTILVELNGTVILDCDLSQVTDFMGDRAYAGKDRTSGHFGFAGHNDPVQFRDIWIKRLEE